MGLISFSSSKIGPSLNPETFPSNFGTIYNIKRLYAGLFRSLNLKFGT